MQRQLFCLPTFTQRRNELKSNQICQPPRPPEASEKITVSESAAIQTEAGEGSPYKREVWKISCPRDHPQQAWWIKAERRGNI